MPNYSKIPQFYFSNSSPIPILAVPPHFFLLSVEGHDPLVPRALLSYIFPMDIRRISLKTVEIQFFDSIMANSYDINIDTVIVYRHVESSNLLSEIPGMMFAHCSHFFPNTSDEVI